MPIRLIITKGSCADCTQASRLIEGLSADYLLADRGYDSNVIIEQAKDQGMKVVIPPRKNRKMQREYISRTLQIAALGRKRLLASKEVARYRHKIREKHCIIPRCRTNQMDCPME